MEGRRNRGAGNALPPVVLVTGRSAGMGVVHGVGKMGVPVVLAATAPNVGVSSSKYTKAAFGAPDPAVDEMSHVEFLAELGALYPGGLLVPATDEAIVAISHHKSFLERFFVVACPDRDSADVAIDKAQTYQLAHQMGIPAPRTVVVDTLDDVIASVNEVGFPCIVKPRRGHLFTREFGVKLLPALNRDQLIRASESALGAGFEVLIQELIPGKDAAGVNYNSFRWPGRPPVEFTSRKVRNSPPMYGSPRVVVSERVPDIVEPARALLNVIDFHGFSNIEFKYDERDKTYKLLEMNARHNRSAKLAIRCGINFPWIDYSTRILGHVHSPVSFEEGVYWVNLLDDVKQSLRYRADEGYSVWEYVKPYVRPCVDATLDMRDLMPIARRVRKVARASFKRS